jgi:hypothetical protein
MEHLMRVYGIYKANETNLQINKIFSPITVMLWIRASKKRLWKQFTISAGGSAPDPNPHSNSRYYGKSLHEIPMFYLEIFHSLSVFKSIMLYGCNLFVFMMLSTF